MSDFTRKSPSAPIKPKDKKATDARLERDRMEDEGGAMGLSYQDAKNKAKKS